MTKGHAVVLRAAGLLALLGVSVVAASISIAFRAPGPPPAISSAEPQPSARAYAHPAGGYVIRLSHSGSSSKYDELAIMGQPALFDLSGTLERELELEPNSPMLPAVSVAGLVLDASGIITPRRAFELLAADGRRWQIDVAARSGERDLTPRQLVPRGGFIRAQIQSVTFGVTSFAALRISDARGLLLALDHRILLPIDDPDLSVTVGARLGGSSDTCGTFTTDALELRSEARVTLRPAERGQLRVRGLSYEAWNLAATFVTDDQRCTDLVNDVAWLVRRLP
jgi:hypothetical protein